MDKPLIWVRGAGELGSAIAVTLFRTGFRLFISELQLPLAIRRTVTFSSAMFEGESTVEGVRAVLRSDFSPAEQKQNHILTVMLDSPSLSDRFKPDIIVDARMLKRGIEDQTGWAQHVIGLGPGFTAPINCTVLVETNRSHEMGRLIWEGSAEANTGVPGELGGATNQRVIYSPGSGELKWNVDFGSMVQQGETIGLLDERIPIEATLSGTVRGLISPRVPITKGLKIADIDPRGSKVNPYLISDKSRSIARAVLEAVLIIHEQNRN